MPVVINGSGSITGLSVGGLPDGSVDADTLASNAVTAAKLASGVGGKALQVVQNSLSTQTNFNSTSYVDTGLNATITPSSTSSKVLIFGWIPVNTSLFASPYKVYGWGFNIVRGSTEIKAGHANLYYQAIDVSGVNYTVFARPHVFNFLDSPNTTSSTTYKIQVKEGDINSGINICGSSTTAEMILIEVGA
tara:strand:- start:254 stop:826 length:573 start_codon:yes stop_codon:yes gene_type:complete